MKRRILIEQIQINKAGQVKLFQVSLPHNTRRIVAIAADMSGMTQSKVGTKTVGSYGEPMEGARAKKGSSADVLWDIDSNPLAGRLIIQSMEKANIFFYDQVWMLLYDDGISGLDSVDSINPFALFKKPESKTVDVPCESTILNCLYRDALGIHMMDDVSYIVKVLIWVECEE